MMSDQASMRRVGVMWRPREGARSLGTGSLTIGGQRQKFVILENRYKRGDRDPDFVLMSSDPAEPDPYAERDQAHGGRRDDAPDADQYDGDAERRARAARPATTRRTPW